jgi:RimJ/RimL family protein N-acetyltransferase
MCRHLRRVRLASDGIMLRPWTMADLPAFWQACQEDDIARWTGFPFTATLDEARQLLRERIDSFASQRAAAFAVISPTSSELYGSVSLLWIDWAASTAEAAYWLRSAARGNGVATRALRLLSRWALDDLKVQRIQLTADVRNLASHRVAERAGFERKAMRLAARTIHGKAIDEYVYVLGDP